MNKQIKVGVVGCGYWGPNLVRNFKSLSNCSLEMMCDVSEQRLKHLRSLYPDVKGEKDFDHLLNGVGCCGDRDGGEVALLNGQGELVGG
jgi:predicted dehydrogenase